MDTDSVSNVDNVNDAREEVITDNSIDEWPLTKITEEVFCWVSFWICVVDIIDNEADMTYKYNIQNIMSNLHLSCTNISSFVRKVKGIKGKIIKKQNVAFLKDTVIARQKENSLGQECINNQITEEWLENPREIEIQVVSRRLVFELRLYRNRHNISYSKCGLWIKFLCKLPYMPHIGNLWLTWERMNKKKMSMKTTETYQSYLNGKYEPPNPQNKCLTCQDQLPENEKTYIEKKSNLKVNSKKEASENKYREIRRKQFMLQQSMFEMKKENNKLRLNLEKAQEKLSCLSIRNVNKRIKRRDQKIQMLTAEQSKLNRQILCTIRQANEVKNKYKRQNALLTYYKNIKQKKHQVDNLKCSKELSKSPINPTSTSDTHILKERLSYLENLNEILNEKLAELMADKQITTFHDGKYSDTVREVYAILLSLNVGVKNIEVVIKTVLEKLASVNVGRLPKKTFAEVMLIEAKAMAQIQTLEAVLSSKNNTLHTDGTKRGGREFGGVQIGTTTGQYSLGIMEIEKGDTESFMYMIKEMMSNLAELSDTQNKENKTAEIIHSIKNMMTDRHVVNTSLKNCIETWKNECLPLIKDNFETFSDEIKAKLIQINHFKCNLHVLVNLGSQAETALKQWEKSVIEETSHYSNFISSSPDFIRATTKLCVPGADHKSGYGLLFQSFLQNCEPPVNLQLSSFHGHRINILFAMGARVFYHRNHIKEFINSYFSNKQNQLVSCVSYYITNNVYLAGCRALGIIDKLLTGPLWRQIEQSKHILDLNDMWHMFLNYLNIFSKDSSELLEGKPIYPQYTKENEVYKSLFTVEDQELNVLTLEALQLLCTNFLIIIHRQLGDFLPGGQFHKDGAKNYAQLRQESENVTSTNIVSERDFANLDRLQREKPNSNTIALEGMILFTNNKTLAWLDSLDVEKKSKIIDTARKAAPKMIQDYKKKKFELKEKHIQNLIKKKADILAFDRKKNEEIVKASEELQKFGGLWETMSDLNRNLNAIKKEMHIEAVKSQIKYHKVVLKDSPSDKTLLQFSAQSKQFCLDQLLKNLKILINLKLTDASDINENICSLPSSTFTIKGKEERDLFMKTQRDIILQKIKNIKMSQSKSRDRDENASGGGDDDGQSNPKRRKQTKLATTISKSNTSIGSEIVNEESVVFHSFSNGQMVAVAYSDIWYPGQVLEIVDQSTAKVKFLHPCNNKNSYRWPDKDDIAVIENLFVFYSNFDLCVNDSKGRTWTVSNIKDINSAYDKYRDTYF